MKDKKLKPFLLIAAIALLLPYFALCFFAHPIADDFDPYILSISLKEWFKFYYTVWEGRYTAIVLTWLFGTHSLVVYRVIAALILLLTAGSAYYLVTSFMGKVFSFFERALTATLFTALILTMLPCLPQAIYWQNGALNYHLGSITAMFYAGLLCRFFQRQYIINRVFHSAFCFLTLFIVIGFNEVLMLIMVSMHGLIWLSLPAQKKFNSYWTWLTIAALLFSIIVFIAPGNVVRANLFSSSNHRLFNSLGMAGLQMLRFFFLWVAYAPLMIASVLFLGISNTLYEHSAIFRRLAGFKWWQVFLFLWVILFLCTFPPYWNTGILGQHRTLNVACVIFLLTWFLFIYTIARKLGLNENAEFLSVKAKNYVALLLTGCILFSGNTGMALLEFGKGEITGFNNEMNSRNKLVEQAKQQGRKEVSVPPLQNKPSSLFVLDLQPDYKHWINVNYAQYMGIDTVKLTSLPTLQRRD